MLLTPSVLELPVSRQHDTPPLPSRVGQVAEEPEARGAPNPRGARRREAPLKFPWRQFQERVLNFVDNCG